jgi:hypothetical protein
MQGIYKITNTNDGKVYIGRSTNIEERWKQHRDALENGTHHSYKLQKCYDKLTNKDVLQYEVIEVVDKIADMPEREQYYYDQYDSYNNGYNCCPYADNPKYRKHSFVFYAEWFEYLQVLEIQYGRQYAGDVLMELITYALHGPEKSNDPGIFGNMYPPFNDWCTENNINIIKEKFYTQSNTTK